MSHTFRVEVLGPIEGMPETSRTLNDIVREDGFEEIALGNLLAARTHAGIHGNHDALW